MPRGRKTPLDQRPSPEELRRLYHDENMTVAQIAEKVKIHASTIYLWLKEAEIERRPSPSSVGKIPVEQRATIPIEDLKRMYVEEGLSLSRISEVTGIAVSTVGVWLNEAGVTMRGTDPEFPYEEGWRWVVRTEEVPYDKTWDGKVLTTDMDVLECGHKVRGGRTTRGGVKSEWQVKPKYRKCGRCMRPQQEEQ